MWLQAMAWGRHGKSADRIRIHYRTTPVHPDKAGEENRGRRRMNGNICQSAFSEPGAIVRRATLTELRAALKNLDNLKGNVQNCDCAPSNCCQSATCQSCQGCQTCQGCQGCQACQRNCDSY